MNDRLTKQSWRAGFMLLALTFWIGSTHAWGQQSPDRLAEIIKRGAIRVANTQSSPPWSMLDEQNRPAGYDVDIAQEVSRRIGIKRIDFVSDSYKNFIEGLQTDKYDLVMNDLTPTPDRKKQVDFSTAYGVEEWYLFVRSNETSISDKSSLRGKRIGVNTGSSNEVWARANLPGSLIKTYETSALNFSDLAAGRIDAVISSHFAGNSVIQLNHLPLKQVGPPLAYALCAAAIRKEQFGLKSAVNVAIDSMIQDGTLNRIARKWLGRDYDMASSIVKASKSQ